MTEEEQASLQLLKDYREVFETPAGKRVMADIMRRAGMFEDNLEDNSIEMAKKVGAENLVKHISILQGIALDVYINTLREGANGREYGTTGTIDGTAIGDTTGWV